MSYNKGQASFSRRGNMWAMIRQLIDAQGGINPSAQGVGAGAELVKATYDFNVDGGAISTILLASSPIIPTGAIIFGGLVDIPVTLTSGGAATVAIGLGSGAQAASLKAATGFATYANGSILPLIPVWTAASAFIVAADTKISVTIAAATVTAGKIAIDIYYHMRGE